MHITNTGKGAVTFTVAGQTIDLYPGQVSRELTAAEADSFAAQPILQGWLAEGLISTDGAPAPTLGQDEAPKPRSKRVKVQDQPEG